MRTTLDIDDDVLQAAKELARAEKKTAGQVLSEAARKGFVSGQKRSIGVEGTVVDGIPVIPSRGAVVTKELVDRLIEQTDLEDAGLSHRPAGHARPL